MRKDQMVVALAIASHFLVACNDATPPTPASKFPTAPEAPAATRSPRARIPVSPAEFHAQNRMDWVGVAHNAAMDQLRAEVRSSRPKDLCKVVERIAGDAADKVAEKGHLPVAERKKIEKSAFDKIGCRGKPALGRNASADRRAGANWFEAANVSQASGEYVMSAEAWAFADEITAAGESAGSAGELASELGAITANAQTLSADDYSVIEALASVSLSSFEYWEQNAGAMAAEMGDAYGSCVADGGGESCYYESSRLHAPSTQAALFRLAANTAGARRCDINVGTIWSGDKWGAAVGLAIGSLTKTVQGAIGGLVVGAATGSGGAAAYEFGRYLECAFK